MCVTLDLLYRHLASYRSQQTQNIFITCVQRRHNFYDVDPTLYKCYKNVLCLLPLSDNTVYITGGLAYTGKSGDGVTMVGLHFGLTNSFLLSHPETSIRIAVIKSRNIFLDGKIVCRPI